MTKTADDIARDVLTIAREDGPMAGLASKLALELIHLHSMKDVPSDRIGDYIAAIVSYYMSVATYFTAVICLESVKSFPEEDRAEVVYATTLMSYADGEKIARDRGDRLDLIRDVLHKDFGEK